MASPGPSGNKLSEMLRAGSQPGSAQHYQEQMESQQQRMAVMAAAVSAGENIPQLKHTTSTVLFLELWSFSWMAPIG